MSELTNERSLNSGVALTSRPRGWARLAVTALSCSCLLATSLAEDKNGLRVLVAKKTLDRADGRPSSMREIDRTMALKATVKNISSKDRPEGMIHCIILIRRWALSEAGSIERHTKELKLEPLKTAAERELAVGEYHIGGHMHGSSDMHVDQLAGWKITIDEAGKKTEFRSGSNFDALNARASDVRS